MKHLFLATAIVTATVQFAIAQFVKPAAPTTSITYETTKYWPLVCRGGSSISIKLNKHYSPMSIELMGVQVGFIRGQMAAGLQGQNLQPGTCSWVDRGMVNTDPAYLHDRAEGYISYDLDHYGYVVSQRIEGIPHIVLKSSFNIYYLYVAPNREGTAFRVYAEHSPGRGQRVPLVEIRGQ